MSKIEIVQMELGPMANFVYLLADPQAKEAFVVDPAWEVPAIKKELEHRGWRLTGMYLTHNHFDHINGVGGVLQFADVPIHIHKEDAPVLAKDFKSNLRELSGGEILKVGDIPIEIMHTPGHTEGSLCFRIHNNLVTGDTLFIRGCGRVDLPSSDPEKMYSSLKKIATLDDSHIVFPGHNYGPVENAALGEEKKANPYLKLVSSAPLPDFLRIVGA